MLLSRIVKNLSSVGLMVLSAGVVSGQDYPNKNIRIMASAAGGGNDFAARLIAQGISGPLGQQVLVDNRTGLLSAEAVSKAPPDGHTLLISGGSFYIGPFFRKAPYDPVADFLPITLVCKEPSILVVHPSVAANSVKELIALAKARPGELNYSSSGTGGPQHLAGELFKALAGVNIVNVPYKGTARAVTALTSGEVHMTITDVGLLAPLVKAGKLRALAATSAAPSALTGGLPTVAASGLPGYEAVGVTGLWAPAKTPGAIINRLNQEIVRFLNLPEAKERFLGAQVEVVANSPEEFAAFLKSDMARWGKLIKEAGLKLD